MTVLSSLKMRPARHEKGSILQLLRQYEPIDPVQARATQGLQAAIRAAAWRRTPPYPFVQQLCAGSLRTFAQILHEVDIPDVAEALAGLLGCPYSTYTWDDLATDQQLLQAWTRLRTCVELAN